MRESSAPVFALSFGAALACAPLAGEQPFQYDA
jgi:hypothetical protein